MSEIRDLKPDINEMGWLEGTFDSRSLFQGEMNITIFDDSDESREYAEKCIEHYNNLNTNQKVLDEIQQKLSAFMFYMYDEWKVMKIYDDIVTDTEKAIEVYKSGKQLLSCLSHPRLYVELPEEEDAATEIGYCIETECPWDDEEYYCIWNDKNKN